MDSSLALVVEDHEDIATIFACALQEAGFEVRIIPTGDAALSSLTEVIPDVVVLDLELPHVPGMEVLHQIRADARLAKTRVIIATAHPDLAVALEEQADLVLIKPISYSQLRDLATRLSLV